ncbi:MAG: endonuclease III [Erysipelotrichaceae bacterium]|nr:endonuclease III [Erysipelotrichaceae bacterium]MBQ1304360.1 endonuclease III [Erysipelotrichaceae bacterium]MBR2792267.1 endonuclease III [Erysipelotrichaceae bacterium]
MASKKADPQFIYEELLKMFPEAHCELNFSTVYQLAVAVMLSAQTTDVSVNRVTGTLFERYPDAEAMSKAEQKDVEEIIKSIGLYRNKASNVISMSRKLQEEFSGVIPDDMDKLTSLPGIGRKSANVILSEGYKHPAIAVDTHVHRVSARLGLAKETDTPDQTEMKLRRKFPKENWSKLHHLMIFFGRYRCHSRNPECDDCPFRENCRRKASR